MQFSTVPNMNSEGLVSVSRRFLRDNSTFDSGRDDFPERLWTTPDLPMIHTNTEAKSRFMEPRSSKVVIVTHELHDRDMLIGTSFSVTDVVLLERFH